MKMDLEQYLGENWFFKEFNTHIFRNLIALMKNVSNERTWAHENGVESMVLKSNTKKNLNVNFHGNK